MGNRIGMLYNYKKIAAIVFVVTFTAILLVPIFTPTANAQGTYSCIFTTDNKCAVDENNCADGFYTGICSGGNPGDCTASKGTCSNTIPIAGRVSNLYNTALGIGIVLALGIIVYGGIQYSASAGNPSVISEAKKWIYAAFSGLAILFGAFLMLNAINSDLLSLKDPLAEQAESQPSTTPTITLPAVEIGDIGTLPGGSYNLSTLPVNGSGKGTILVCGDDNPCSSGTFLEIEVVGTEIKSIADMEALPGTVVRGDQASYIVIAGDIKRAVFYENMQFGGVKITIDKDGDTYKCTVEHKTASGKDSADCGSKLASLIGNDVVGLNLHKICIADDDSNGICNDDLFGGNENWGDDISSLKVNGGTGGNVGDDGTSPVGDGLLPGGVAKSDNTPPVPDLSLLENGSGEGVIYLCGNTNPCTSGNYLGIPVIGSGIRNVEDMGNLDISVAPHVGDGQTSYIIIGGDISIATFFEDKDLKGNRFTIFKVGTGYKCITAGDENGSNDCSNKLINLAGLDAVGINLHKICRIDDNHDGNCGDYWGDQISSVNVVGG